MMTYEEMELFLFGDNINPIPGSWYDEVVKFGLVTIERQQPELLEILRSMARQQRNEMAIASLGLVVATQ